MKDFIVIAVIVVVTLKLASSVPSILGIPTLMWGLFIGLASYGWMARSR